MYKPINSRFFYSIFGFLRFSMENSNEQSSSLVRYQIKPYNRRHQRDQKKQFEKRNGFLEDENAGQHRKRGAQSRPNGVSHAHADAVIDGFVEHKHTDGYGNNKREEPEKEHLAAAVGHLC